MTSFPSGNFKHLTILSTPNYFDLNSRQKFKKTNYEIYNISLKKRNDNNLKNTNVSQNMDKSSRIKNTLGIGQMKKLDKSVLKCLKIGKGFNFINKSTKIKLISPYSAINKIKVKTIDLNKDSNKNKLIN